MQADGSSGSTDATGTSASFDNPMGITTDGTNLYVADNGNDRIRIIVIDNGTVTTLAGSSQGSTDATGTSASFNNPHGITTDGTNLYVADESNHRIRKIVIDNGTVTTIAGSSQGYTDATGTSARFYRPRGITTDGTNLYVADMYNHRIRKIVIDNGTVTTIAGQIRQWVRRWHRYSSKLLESLSNHNRWNESVCRRWLEQHYSEDSYLNRSCNNPSRHWICWFCKRNRNIRKFSSSQSDNH